jgi:hypothetical protein
MPSARSGKSLGFDIAKLRCALDAIRAAHTLHEGLYRAFIEDLQWIESYPSHAAHAGSGLELLVSLTSHPQRNGIDRRAREAIRGLSEDEAIRLVRQIEFLLAVLEQAEARAVEPSRRRTALRH